MEWNYFDKFDAITDKYLPERGEGSNRASQAVTAVCKLVYKWYNDGDVYDNTCNMTGWANDLSSYANWLARYAGVKQILDGIWECADGEAYERILAGLADAVLDAEKLEHMSELPTVGSVYECDGEYRFEERYEEDEDEWDETDW